MSSNNDCSAIILSAGNSSRMKEHKALLPFDENKTFVEKIVESYLQFGCYRIVVVVNPNNYEKISALNLTCKIVVNKTNEKGRFYSLKKGLEEILNSNFVFIHNVDNPFVNCEILNKIFLSRSDNCYVSPVFNNKGGHPILLPKKIYARIQTEKAQNQNLKLFLQLFCRKNVLINDSKILLNINSKEDYNKFFK